MPSDRADNSAKRLSPAYPLALAFLCLALAAYAELQYVHQLGFPDGFVTELGAAERELALRFQLLSLLLLVWFLYLGLVSFGIDARRRVLYTAVLYAAAIGAFIAIDLYYQAHLVGGGGA